MDYDHDGLLIDHTQVSVEINEPPQNVKDAATDTPSRLRARPKPGPKSRKKYLLEADDDDNDFDDEIETKKPKRKRKPRAKPKIKTEPEDGENPPEVKVKVKAKRKRWVPKLVPMNPNDPQACNFCSSNFENWKNFAKHVEEKHKDKLEERKRLKVKYLTRPVLS